LKKRRYDQCIFSKQTEKYRNENKKAFLDFIIKETNKSKLLDLGCSDGKFTKKIASVIGTDKIYGIEVNKNLAKKAKEKGIKVKISDLNKKFPFKNETFDIVSANQVIEHVWDTDNFFKEVKRVLKKGGYSIISTVNLSSFHSIFFILLGQQTPVINLTDVQVGNCLRGYYAKGHYHQKAFNIPVLKDLSEYYGFKIESIKGNSFYFCPKLLQKLLSNIVGKYAIYLTMRIRKVD